MSENAINYFDVIPKSWYFVVVVAVGMVALLYEHVLPDGGQGFNKVLAFQKGGKLGCLRTEGC